MLGRETAHFGGPFVSHSVAPSNVALTISSPVPAGSHTVTVQSNALTRPDPVVNGTALLNVAILNP